MPQLSGNEPILELNNISLKIDLSINDKFM
jgi:hypothetical protein